MLRQGTAATSLPSLHFIAVVHLLTQEPNTQKVGGNLTHAYSDQSVSQIPDHASVLAEAQSSRVSVQAYLCVFQSMIWVFSF